jgi:hypothetical protein
VRSGNECDRETRQTPGLINEVYCLGVGQYVTYYSDQLFNGKVALLLICEVEVYGEQNKTSNEDVNSIFERFTRLFRVLSPTTNVSVL